MFLFISSLSACGTASRRVDDPLGTSYRAFHNRTGEAARCSQAHITADVEAAYTIPKTVASAPGSLQRGAVEASHGRVVLGAAGTHMINESTSCATAQVVGQEVRAEPPPQPPLPSAPHSPFLKEQTPPHHSIGSRRYSVGSMEMSEEQQPDGWVAHLVALEAT